jgi:galactokinase
MSSSSALVTATFFAIAAANHLRDHQEFRRNLSTAEQLATYLACVENGSSFSELTGDSGVGTFGGSEDHTAILCCEAGMLSQFSFCPLRFERKIKMPQDLIFVIAASGIAADKTGSAQQHYNRLSIGVLSILNIWNEAAGRRDISLGAAVTSSPTAVDQIRALLRAHQDPSIPADFLTDRFEQFLLESCAIVPQAADAFARSDWNRFASLVEQSQVNAERLLRNQVPQTSFLAHSAKELGATAASAFGAGFGGSVWALVDKEKSHEFMTEWSARFHATFPQNSSATFFSSAPGPPLQAL